MEKGTTNGTVTDFDGNFKIKVKAGATLVFSYVGYLTQELPAQNGMQVMLKEDSKHLQEVVVTGYTTQRKADLTGAISTVSVDEMAKQNENNPMKALQGRVPGMNISATGTPSGAATVRIRGNGSLEHNDPLYIIDGVDINHSSRYGQERRVETIEHASMAWQDVSAVLNTQGALEERFDQVAPGSKHYYHQSETCPLEWRIVDGEK